MGLVKVTQTFEGRMHIELVGAAGLKGVHAVGGVRVVAAEVDGFAEPVGGVDAEACPARDA
ncbi:hypothetical protein D3C83_333090 [compost metagenome]